MTKRICILTAGHLATSPRMLKAADAFAEAGYRVRVVSTRQTPWADVADVDIVSRRKGMWSLSKVDYRREAMGNYLKSGARNRTARRIARLVGPSRLNLWLLTAARERASSEIVSKVVQEPVDFVYGGGGALGTTAIAAAKLGVRFGIDLEDFHSGEHADSVQSRLTQKLTERIEERVLTSATFLTAGSDAIANAYARKYGVKPIAINNTFTLPEPSPASERHNGPLRLYWFSQTIGSGRGLEDLVAAIGVAKVASVLHLRGRPVPGYLEQLSQLAKSVAPQLQIVDHRPANPDEMIQLCRDYDVGVGLEQAQFPNASLALSNKVLTYVLAGLAVVLTDTIGHRPLAESLKSGVLVYAPGDVETLARGLSAWARDPLLLAQAKAASWQAAQTRWHWDHAEEKGKLLGMIESALR